MSLPRYEPMLATPWRLPFTDPDWLFEPKWDGIRGILAWDGSAVSLRSRTGRDIVDRYPELRGAELERPCVLDGEVVVLDETGRASFERLQQRSALTPGALQAHPVSFVAFDLLHLGDDPLIAEPLDSRLAALGELQLPEPLRASRPREDGLALWEEVVEHDLEGLVAKRRASAYRPGGRSPDWRKVSHLHTVRALVGGYTTGERARAGSFGALVLGLRQGEKLRWIGSVGTGFSDEALRAIRSTLDQLERRDSPFHEDREMPPVTYVEPALVAAVDYRNWTNAGRIRQPRFKGFTDDPLDSITWEREGPLSG